MKNQEFDIDLTDLESLELLFKRSKRTFVRAAVGTVNNLAFSSRKNYIDEILDSMTVRNKKFVERNVRVTTAKARDLDNIEALAGSINGPRFTGWGEQERGDPPSNNRTITAFGRIGADSNRNAKGPARAKSNNKFAKISDYTIKASSRKHRLIIFLQMMVDKKKTFVMPRKYKGLKRGVYFATGKKIRRVQTFGPRKVEKEPWMLPVNNRLKQQDIQKEWKKTLDYLLQKKL